MTDLLVLIALAVAVFVACWIVAMTARYLAWRQHDFVHGTEWRFNEGLDPNSGWICRFPRWLELAVRMVENRGKE